MSDTDASVGLVVSLVTMIPLIVIGMVVFWKTKSRHISAWGTPFGAVVMMVFGIGLIGFFLLHLLF